MEKVKKIVYLMLENRSFDSVLGWLYEHNHPKKFINCGDSPEYLGLQNGDHSNPNPRGGVVPVSQIQPSQGQKIPSMDPHEKFQYVTNQLYYQDTMGVIPNMFGFYADFLSKKPDNPEQVMQSFTPESLPMMNFLAGNFAVSDNYFSSIPSQTDCNRAFSLTGNSIGEKQDSTGHEAFVNNVPEDEGTYRYYVGKTIWNVLIDNNIQSTDDWMVYYSDLWRTSLDPYCFTQDLFWPNLKHQSDHFVRIRHFIEHAHSETLPKFSYLEPAWTILEDGIGLQGNDYHPPGNVGPGEHFLSQIYNALYQDGKNEDVLLIINFDEHGGTYDHIPPPTNSLPPWAGPDGTRYPGSSEFDFDFKRFGVRVPLILISPYIDESTVFRSPTETPFDHTSVIATILEFFNLTDRSQWGLGSRVKNAPSFGFVVDRETPRSMPRTPPLPSLSADVQCGDIEYNDLQSAVVHRMLQHHKREQKIDQKLFDASYKKHFENVKTVKELNIAANKVLADIEACTALNPISTSLWARIVAFIRRLFGIK